MLKECKDMASSKLISFVFFFFYLFICIFFYLFNLMLFLGKNSQLSKDHLLRDTDLVFAVLPLIRTRQGLVTDD